MTIKNLALVDFRKIHQAFSDAFSNYQIPFELSESQLKYMLKRRGYNPDLSYGVFEGDKMVCFILNGIGTWNDKKTAYDTGTGTIKSYQGKGYAKKLFAHTVNRLKANGFKQYLLEVIKTNENAFKLYSKSGFKIRNHYDYYNFKKSDMLDKKIKLSGIVSFMQASSVNWKVFQTFWDFNPSWQNNIDSLERVTESINCYIAKVKSEIVGYVIVEPHTGDIPQLAVLSSYRRKGIGSKLLYKASKASDTASLKIINISESNEAFKSFMISKGIEKGKGQFEMILDI